MANDFKLSNPMYDLLQALYLYSQLSNLLHNVMYAKIAMLDVKYSLEFEDLQERMQRLIKQVNNEN